MSKAFTKESDDDDDEVVPEQVLPVGVKNYITPVGYARLKDELAQLLDKDRPEVVRTVSWAASNGDRSENADYIYGKRRLREIDRRIRFLIKRLEIAEVVDPATQDSDRVFFGATVTVENTQGETRKISIVGMDEIDTSRGFVSWISPIAKTLIKSRVGDVVVLKSPGGEEELEVLEISYETLDAS